MYKYTAYYAHPYVTEECGSAFLVECKLAKELPEIKLVNPFKVGDLTEKWVTNKEKSVALSKQIVRKDLTLMQQSDLLISFFPDMAGNKQLTGGIGTPIEFWYFRYHLQRPAYALTPYIHPWITALEVRCETDIDRLIKRIRMEMKL
ncbi:MAG: hypothetical protein NWE98_02020 [Candidatus Bathyarchaeota archaeon]|nr:hypothetical protein [Candidatus Bathyarchaeota archaeon]